MFDETATKQLYSLIRREVDKEVSYQDILGLVYLIDRKGVEEIGSPVTFDSYYSSTQGIVIPQKTFLRIRSGEWEKEKGKSPGVGSLSRAIIRRTKETVSLTGGKPKDHIRSLPEYKPHLCEITLPEIMKCLGIPPRDVQILIESINCHNSMRLRFGKL